METLENIGPLLFPGGAVGKLAVVAFAWTVAAALAHLTSILWLLHRFSKEGPVIPLLLPQLEQKWSKAMFNVGIWLWFRRVGLAAICVALLLAVLQAGLYLHSVFSAGLVDPFWLQGFLDHVHRVYSVLLLSGLALAIRFALGGLSGLVTARARTFVSASTSLVSPEDIERARRFLEGIEDQGGPPDAP